MISCIYFLVMIFGTVLLLPPAAASHVCGISVTLPPQQKLELAEPVFNYTQMKKGAPRLKWTRVSATTMQTVLSRTAAGEDLSGVHLTREIRERPGLVSIRFILENRTSEKRYVSFGFRSRFRIGNDGTDRNYIPTENNVLDLDNQSSLWGYYTKPGEWYFNLVEPWVAVLHPGSRRGLACLVDYDILSAGYFSDDMLTRGFMFDGGHLPPGEKFSTEIIYRPLRHLKNICFVSKEFCAGFSGTGTDVNLELLPFQDRIYAGSVKISEAAGTALLEKTFSVQGKAFQSQVLSFRIAPPRSQTVNFGIINGTAFEQYRENNFRTSTFPMTPAEFTHTRTMPPKKHSGKTNAAEAIIREKKALILFGFYADFFRFEKILSGYQLRTIPAIPQGIQDIPPAISIDSYRYIILGDVNEESVRPMLTRLTSYVENGGTLVVCGGPFAFGCGGYSGSALEKILPVSTRPFDLLPAAGNEIYDRPVAFATGGADAPQLWWIHKVHLKAGARVLLKAGPDPLLVRGTYGRGTVIAFLGTPLGNPGKNDRPWWDSPVYISLMKQILADAAGKEVRP